MNTDTRQRHDHIANVVLAVLVGLAGLGALLDATGYPLLTTVGLVLVAALVGAARWMTRRVRERREDAADLVAGAAWPAEHMPHLVTETDRAVIERDRQRAGVA